MTPQAWGLIIGGVVPALCYAAINVLLKYTNQQGMSVGAYLVWVGLGIIAVGYAFLATLGGPLFISRSATIAAIAGGVFWALGSGFVVIALTKFGTPISQLIPIFNANTLIAVALTLVIFAEWKNVSVPPLLIGTALIVAGTIFVARA